MSNSFIKSMNNVIYTENGALTNKSTLNANLDWFFHGPAMRGQDKERIVDCFMKAFETDPQLALRTLFYIRDCRGGQGERDVFRTVIKECVIKDIKFRNWIHHNLNLIQEYGRWDDYLVLLDTSLVYITSKFLYNQLLDDKWNVDQNQYEGNNVNKVSLLAKWMPSLTSSKESKRLANIFIRNVARDVPEYNQKFYRQQLSILRKYLKIVEHNLTNKNYKEIKYENVPSYAMLKYHNAFERNDNVNFLTYMDKVKKGEKKINSSVLYPYDLVSKYNYDYGINDTIEEQWKSLPDYVPEINGVVVYDTSGSMIGRPMNVSMSLAIYIAERNKSEVWKNYVIPFSSRAEWKEVKGSTLRDKLKSIYTGDCSNTNLQSVFDLILSRAIENKIPQSDMPKVLLIVTDMEFDIPTNYWSYGNRFNSTNFEVIKAKYKQAGYEMPKMVWWNVASRNTQSPVTIKDDGNILLSGCSPAVLNVALGGEYNPVEAMERVVNSKRYENIKYYE